MGTIIKGLSDMLQIYHQDAEHPAVQEKHTVYTYGQFWTNVRHLCNYLERMNIRKVAVIAEQGYTIYCWLWAVYLSGGTFCCINREYPEHRIIQCLKLYRPELTVTQISLPQEHLGCFIDPKDGVLEDIPPILTPRINEPNEIAYILMTSGSTGEPKGVRIRRDAFEEVIESAVDIFQLSSKDCYGQFSNVSFDTGICDIFAGLSSGATLIPIKGMDRLRPATMIGRYGITFWYSVPTVLDIMEKRNEITEENLHSLRAIGFGGATLYGHHVEKLFRCNGNLTIINTYGPSEITIFSSVVVMKKDTYHTYCDGSVCIGSEIANVTQILQLVDDGLYQVIVDGNHVYDGYLNEENCDCEIRFYKNMKQFETGDLVRINNGERYFVCRNDMQTKYRGNRIDLNEIDTLIREKVIVKKVVIATDDMLVAFIESSVSDAKLREVQSYLRKRLPKYSIPSEFIRMQMIPCNVNGKYDRATLKKLLLERKLT